MWGYSSAGRALDWQSRGQRFDPAYLHQKSSGFQSEMIGNRNFFICIFRHHFRCDECVMNGNFFAPHGFRFCRIQGDGQNANFAFLISKTPWFQGFCASRETFARKLTDLINCLYSEIYRLATVLDCEYTDSGALITAECDARACGTFEKFIV